MTGRLYRTSDGRVIELPPDMTREEAARLEAEAIAAQKRLGKGPPPQPVPDVKKLDKKEIIKGKPLPGVKGKKETAGKGKGPRKSGATPKTLQVASTSQVAQYLGAKAAPVLGRGIGKLQNLRRNEQTHDEAGEKLIQSEKAVVNPPSEGQAASNTGQVKTVSARPAPTPDENKAKQRLEQSLAENVPQTIEDVDNFKRDQKAQHMGADVMLVVQGDKSAVASTFKDVETTPPPAPPEQTPEALPPQEVAPGTANMNLGQGAIAPLQKEHTDLSNYTKEADSKLKEEGVTQEQLDMVDSGELAEANKEKKGMENAAKTQPLMMQQFAQQEAVKIDKDLGQEEKKQRGAIQSKRKTSLGATATKQKGTKSALEKKRDEVAAKINNIYKTAQDKVKQRLADLETRSMKRFDDGNAKATKEFEDNVNREIDAFKDDRYSGVFGWARKAKDWLLGMDDLPEVKAIFDRNRTAFVRTINKLVEEITADNKRVIQECKDELANARKTIQEYVDKLGPDLKAIGKQAASEMGAKLDEMDRFVANKEQELQDQLKDKQQAAIKAIDEKIEKMKEAMSGALAKLGKLLLLAAKKFFTWALEKFGFSLSDIESIINKGAAVLKAIFTKPIPFVKNLMNAAITGFKNFGKNFLKHLKDALFEWLTGSLEGLVLPSTWDLKGIIGVALQMIGISYQNIRKHMVAVMGENVVVGLEKTFTLVKTLITQGPMAAWEQLKEMAGEMRDAFVEAVKDFIKTKIIEQAIQWLVSLFIPGAGIIKAIIGIYDTIVFFIKKAKDIAKMIGNFLGSIAEIAAGNIGAAADAMEKGLARGLSLVISFLAQLLHLSGITNKIRDAIQKIRGKVDDVLLKVVKWIADKAKALFGKGVSAVKAGVGAVTQWWKTRKPFTTKDGQKHALYFTGEGKNAKLIIASSPTTYTEWVLAIATPPGNTAIQEAKSKAIIVAQKIDALKNKDAGTGMQSPDIVNHLNELATYSAILAAGISEEPPSVIEYGPVNAQGGATEMNAKILSKNHPAGSQPTDMPPIMQMVSRRKKIYIQGHLLNDNLGGPGRAYNLTPITGTYAGPGNANATHHKVVEKIIKKVVGEGKVVRYRVKVLYGKHADPSFKKVLEQRIGTSGEKPQDKLKLQIIEYEQNNLARALLPSWAILKHDGKAWKEDVAQTETPITNHIPQGDFEI